MIKRSLFCSGFRSELRVAAIAAMSSAVLGAAVGGAAAPGSGTVSGSITIEQASIRSDGPKHDRDVVVMLESADSKTIAASGFRASMDQSGLVFVPHVLPVPVGATVTFLNSDNEQHNVYFLDDATGDTLDIGTWGPGVSVDHTFETPGMVITLCKLHLEMAAYVIVAPSPWYDHVEVQATDVPTRFEIDGAPQGDYVLSVWHKKLKQKGGPVPIRVHDGAQVEVNVVLTQARFARPNR